MESVTSLITETSSTDIQSYAELVLYRNGSNKEYTYVCKPNSIRLTQSFNRVSYSNKTRVHRTLSDRTPFAAVAKLPPDLFQESVSDIDIPALHNGVGEFRGSRESLEEEYPEYRDFDSTTPSDASTVIFRELPSSRCSSNLPVPGEECFQAVHSVGGSYNSSPITSRHAVATAGEEGVVSSPQIHRYSVETALTDSKTTPVGFEGSGATSPGINGDSNSHEFSRHLDSSLEVSDSVASEASEGPALPVGQEPSEHCIKESEPDYSAVVDNTSTCARSSNGITDIPDRKKSTEQVTDIYTSELNHTLSPAKGTANSKDGNFHGNGVFFERPLEQDKKMENYIRYQNGGGPVVDSDPIGIAGVRTRGYASNDSKVAMYPTTATTTTPAVDVPHHSLTLALSDPESPSSCQVSN